VGPQGEGDWRKNSANQEIFSPSVGNRPVNLAVWPKLSCPVRRYGVLMMGNFNVLFWRWNAAGIDSCRDEIRKPSGVAMVLPGGFFL